MAPSQFAPCLFAALLALAAATRDASSKPLVVATQGRRLRTVSLADVSADAITQKASSVQHGKAQNPLPSGWFGDFAQDESTYTPQGLDASKDDPGWAVRYGKDPSLESPFTNPQVFKSEFFQESESGGSKAAYQTNYPSLSSGIAGNRATPENDWRQTPSGWVQDYRPERKFEAGPARADWFDNSVAQVDGFSRQLTPSGHDGLSFADSDWKERSVNTTISCKAPGCTATSSLQLFATDKEEARNCKLSIHIHPTDYDDDFGAEHVEHWKVNGYVAARECNPRARGCNSTAEKPLYPCLNSFDVDKVVNTAGSLVIEGKNSIMVDECPYKSNLLSGVAMATCMIRSKSTAGALLNQTKGDKNATTSMFTMADMLGEGVMKCDKPGCTATTHVYFSPAIALNGGKCTMNVSVHQTDFDDALGLPEQIDFIQVEGKNITTGPLQPGKNPCNERYKGTNVTADSLIFSAVKEYDITQLIKDSAGIAGALKVSGKISDQVDECGHEGNLLFGNVTIRCVPPASFVATPPAIQTSLLHRPPPVAGLLQRQRGNVQRAARGA